MASQDLPAPTEGSCSPTQGRPRRRALEWLLEPADALARKGWPFRLLTRSTCWLGTLALIVWGGVNTVVGHLVLAGVIQPQSGYDRAGMIGHAYLWDPLFLAWGVALAIGLFASRGRDARWAFNTPC